MRLWHQDLISVLDSQRLLGQHRECCALRGLGWGKKHSVVNYVFTYNPIRIYSYHVEIMSEMLRRGYKVDPKWLNPYYRGKRSLPFTSRDINLWEDFNPSNIFPEHNSEYLLECINNLKSKGVEVKLNN